MIFMQPEGRSIEIPMSVHGDERPTSWSPAEGGQPLPLAHKLWSLPAGQMEMHGDAMKSPRKLLL